MAHPIFKPEPNLEYPLEMLAGPYGDNDTKGPVQGKYGPQWKYLVKVSDVAHYWYATPQTNEMLEELRLTSKGAPFTVVKRTKDGKNVGFEISGQTYDDIFGDPRTPPTDNQPPLSPPNDAPSNINPDLESRLVIFSESVNDRFRKMSEDIKRLDGEISGVRKAIEALGEPFPENGD